MFYQKTPNTNPSDKTGNNEAIAATLRFVGSSTTASASVVDEKGEPKTYTAKSAKSGSDALSSLSKVLAKAGHIGRMLTVPDNGMSFEIMPIKAPIKHPKKMKREKLSDHMAVEPSRPNNLRGEK
jgi:hypothetical protein